MKSPFVIFLFLLMAGVSSAIVVQDYSVATNAPTGDYDVNWDYVYYYKTMSSVAVGSHWLLTAGHTAMEMENRSSTVVIDGVEYYEQEVYLHDPSDDPEHFDIADLALVRFDKPFPGYYPLYINGFPGVTGRRDDRLNAVMVGWGNTGTVSSTSYTVAGTGSHVKRWGSNKIDGEDNGVAYSFTNFREDPDVTVSTVNDGLKILFTQSETTYEAGVAVFDSGGGTFVEESGVWKLAGINTIRYGPLGGPYTGTFAVSVPAYETWITQIMDSVTGDADSDGIPNWWEEQYETDVLAAVDQDGDGLTGEEEYVADTDPTNGDDFFEIDAFVASSNQTVTFTGSTARQYQLFFTTNSLASTNLVWTPHGSPIWGEGPDTQIAATHQENAVFYRVWVTLP